MSNVYTLTYIYIYTNIIIPKEVCVNSHTHTHTHIYIYIYIYIYTYISVCVCVWQLHLCQKEHDLCPHSHPRRRSEACATIALSAIPELVQWLLNPCWLMISSGIQSYPGYIESLGMIIIHELEIPTLFDWEKRVPIGQLGIVIDP